jgi:hypothetical protein
VTDTIETVEWTNEYNPNGRQGILFVHADGSIVVAVADDHYSGCISPEDSRRLWQAIEHSLLRADTIERGLIPDDVTTQSICAGCVKQLKASI